MEVINLDNYDDTGEYIHEITHGGVDLVLDCVGMDCKMGHCPVHSYIEPILKLIKQNKFNPTDIITHRLSLDQGSHAYEMFDKKEDGCIKVVLKP